MCSHSTLPQCTCTGGCQKRISLTKIQVCSKALARAFMVWVVDRMYPKCKLLHVDICACVAAYQGRDVHQLSCVQTVLCTMSVRVAHGMSLYNMCDHTPRENPHAHDAHVDNRYCKRHMKQAQGPKDAMSGLTSTTFWKTGSCLKVFQSHASYLNALNSVQFIGLSTGLCATPYLVAPHQHTHNQHALYTSTNICTYRAP